METLFPASRPTTFGTPNFPGGRNYDYTNIYSPDKRGEETKENARVWNVYLDEAESHDADMIKGYRSIIDSLLVFAALFSAVVTTFVAQTSQVLQPDNGQIVVSLLVETNQLLRAAGNKSLINAMPAASLGPESRTYTSIDVWVNGLFFTSLALSLSTALLSVLAKQWIQAYTATVSGDARTRALIRQFRFEGLVKWKLGKIIEMLPLILHCSVAIFLVGLALYVSQLSRPICGIVAGITAVTFLFYFASSVLPAFYLACPYRIPFIFLLARLLIFAFGMTRWKYSRLWYMLTHKFDHGFQGPPWPPQWSPRQPLKKAEHEAVFEQSRRDDSLAYNSLDWVFNNSSNRFVKEIVIEGTCGLLDQWSSLEEWYIYRVNVEYVNLSSGNSHLLSAIKYSLSRLPDTYSRSSMEDEIGNNEHGRLIVAFMKAFHLTSLLDEPTAGFKDWETQIRPALFENYKAALGGRNHVLSQWLLDFGGPNLLSSSKWNSDFLISCIFRGDAEDFHDLVHRGIDLNCRDSFGRTALHCAAQADNLDVAIAVVEQEPGLISAQTHSGFTALDLAVQYSYDPPTNQRSANSYTMVTYLLDHGAQSSSYDALYYALVYLTHYAEPEKVTLLLDCGWDRQVKDAEGKALLDIARSKGDNTLVEYLEHYQTVRFAPYGMKSHTVNEETP